MGNNTTKSDKTSLLSKDEIPLVVGCFKNISKNNDKIKEDELMKFWGSQMDPRLAQFIINFLFGPVSNRNQYVELKSFSELYVYCVRGSIDERVTVLYQSMGQVECDNADIAYPVLKEYVEAVVSSYLRALRIQADIRYKSWEMKNFKIAKDCVQKLGESLVYDVVQQSTQKVMQCDTEKWLQSNPTFLKMLKHVFLHLYSYRIPTGKNQSVSDETIEIRKKLSQEDSNLLPECEGLINIPQFPAFIDISQIIYLNANLPNDFKHKWRFLFSSQMHGESFSTFLGRIQNQGSTIIILEDSNGYVFGGFSPSEWNLSPNFKGNETSFLFTLKPKMRCFFASGYNDHYQYLNLHQQTMPNGLGMGGQFEYWGLWIDSEYGNGQCSESCTTYKNYIQLASAKNFKIKNIEVWGVGDIPVRDEDNGERVVKNSVLDDTESRAMLDIAGVKQHSAGIREQKPEDAMN